MKQAYNYLTLFSLLFLPFLADGQYVIDWDDPIEVSEAGMDNNRPRITLNAEGNPLIIWGRDSGKELFFTRFDGVEFSEGELLLDADFDIFTADWAGPEISSNGDDAFIVFKRFPENEFGAYMLKSTDGGQSWSDTIRVDAMDIGEEQNRFPNVTVNNDGNPAVTLMKFTGNYLDPEYEVLTSVDGGTTFGPMVNASTSLISGEACDCCTADLINSNGKLIQLYRNNASNIREIKATVSDDWGGSFGEAIHVDNSDTFSNVCFSSGPDGIIAGDKLITVYRANIPAGYRVYVSEYDLELGTLDNELLVDPFVPSMVAQHNPKIAGDEMHQLMVWEEFTAAYANVLYTYSSTGPEGLNIWSDTLNVQTNGRQVNPDVAYDNGNFHVVWQDKYSGKVGYRKGKVVEGVSVNDLAQPQVKVYPNPCVSEVNLTQLSRQDRVEMRNVLGQIVFEDRINSNELLIPMEGLPDGTYVIGLFSEGELSTSINIIKSK